MLKGKSKLLVIKGKIQWPAMRELFITKKELRNAIHKSGNMTDISKVKAMYIENTGEISVIK